MTVFKTDEDKTIALKIPNLETRSLFTSNTSRALGLQNSKAKETLDIFSKNLSKNKMNLVSRRNLQTIDLGNIE